MRFMAGEHLPRPVVELLRGAGHDVTWALEVMPSAPDSEVLARAVREDRVVVTYDKEDYGSLIYQEGRPAQCGVVLFRFRNTPYPNQVQFIFSVLSNDAIGWRGNFTTIRTGPVPGV